MKFKYLKSFKLFESSSAGSHDLGTSEVSPFKYALNYDHRLGYSKNDFVEDLKEIYTKSSPSERKEIMDVIFKNAGVFRITSILELAQDRVDILMKKMEEHLDSKSEYKPEILPDGFILCFENLFKDNRKCDLYYSPNQNKIKICFTDVYPESEEVVYNFMDFSPGSLNISNEDFDSTINKCKEN